MRRHTREAYREAILEAAKSLFSRVGFADATMSALADEAGVSVGTLYNYFESRDEVIQRLIEHEAEQLIQYAKALDPGSDPLERLRQMLRNELRYVEEQGALMAMAIRAGVVHPDRSASADPETAEQVSRKRILALHQELLAEAATQGQIRSELSPELLAPALDGMLSAFVHNWLASDRTTDLASQCDFVFDLFLRGARCD
jgi:AcrR family transcriptional regulator